MDARLVLREAKKGFSRIEITNNLSVGDRQLLIIGGPCAVESAEQMKQVAHTLKHAPVGAIRGGVFKPRTSPYSFQGMKEEGLRILAEIRREFGIPVVAEAMSERQLAACEEHADMLQIGSRNMQNFELLKAAGRARKPVILKRGLSATIEEFLLAAEYIMSEGNERVILCERGIRSFDPFTRNVLDLGAVVALKNLTHLPVIVDPSHAAGKSELVADLALAAIACGADGIMIECHPQPNKSVSDARQALSLEEMCALVNKARPIAEARGRVIAAPKTHATERTISRSPTSVAEPFTAA
ncbi:MAG: 3-deoxy-7-phosphoheptulonate synthase [Candidatus Obscuribacterales bacterium]|nr:3-deoxy-7-phosphoheptulonate synthase [Candidatus Obscuribacterales bacterium]